MKPNTPTKMTMISHITYWCRSVDVARELRARRLEIPVDGVRADAAEPSPARPARAVKELRSPHVVRSPNLDPQSLLQLVGERARGCPRRGAAPAQVVPAPRSSTHAFLFEAHARPARIHLVARMSLCACPTSTVNRPASSSMRSYPRRGAHTPRTPTPSSSTSRPANGSTSHAPTIAKPAPIASTTHRQRREHAGKSSRRNRAIALEGQAEAGIPVPERQLARRFSRRCSQAAKIAQMNARPQEMRLKTRTVFTSLARRRALPRVAVDHLEGRLRRVAERRAQRSANARPASPRGAIGARVGLAAARADRRAARPRRGYSSVMQLHVHHRRRKTGRDAACRRGRACR